jgi:hypothetical protein
MKLASVIGLTKDQQNQKKFIFLKTLIYKLIA